MFNGIQDVGGCGGGGEPVVVVVIAVVIFVIGALTHTPLPASLHLKAP